MKKGIHMLLYCKYLVKWYDYTVVSLFRQTVQKYPNKAMLVNCATGKEWTYTEVILFKLDHYSNGIIHTNKYKDENKKFVVFKQCIIM